MHWDRSKSGDELDALARHLLDAGTKDTDGAWHDTKIAWRALANLEKLLEQQAEAQANAERPLPVGWYDFHEQHQLSEMAQSTNPAPVGAYERTSGTIGPRSSNGPVEAAPGPGNEAFKMGDLGDQLGALIEADQIAGLTLPAPFVPLDDEASPFMPMSFIRPPRTEDPEDDGEAVADAVAAAEAPEVEPEPDAIMLRRTSEDRPVTSVWTHPAMTYRP
jgi:hypothetical protein